MENELIVKPKTEVAPQSRKKDILELYGVPDMLDRIVSKEKKNYLNSLSCSSVIIDSLNKLAHSEDFIVEIPEGLKEMIKSGGATFDESKKSPGAYTPNIRIKGKKGIAGQARIVKKTDPQAVTQTLSNLAMMAMVQSVLEKLNTIEEKIEDIKKGQKNDRIGMIIGYFKGFTDLYPTYKTSEELNRAADDTYRNMQSGLAMLHLQIEDERKKLDHAPSNWWQAFWKSITHPFHNESERYQKCYENFVYDIQLYNRLILLTDVILYIKGDNELIRKNHELMFEYCKNELNDQFIVKMNYLMARNTTEIDNIFEYNDNIRLALEGVLTNSLKIECKKEDIILLDKLQYESEKC